jgi:chemotaxis protein CheD
VFLDPGEYYFGEDTTRVRTLLGSCVAVTMWHPRRRIGGMCHFLLPDRGRREATGVDGRYGVEAIGMLMRQAENARTHPREYLFKLFGGGNMFPHLEKRPDNDIGGKNIECARRFLENAGFAIDASHLGGNVYRNVVFDIWSGNVWMKHRDVLEMRAVANG